MIDELKRRLVQSPFVPFQIVLADGRRLDVLRRSQMGVGMSKFIYVFPDQSQSVHSEESQIVSLEHPGTAKANA